MRSNETLARAAPSCVFVSGSRADIPSPFAVPQLSFWNPQGLRAAPSGASQGRVQMNDRFFPDKQITNEPVARPVSARVIGWLAAIGVAGALLSGGFVLSARQHFEAIAVGYQSEQLRRQSAQLEERLRQLELEYARASSPVEIERRAKKLGLERPDKKVSGSESPRGASR